MDSVRASTQILVGSGKSVFLPLKLEFASLPLDILDSGPRISPFFTGKAFCTTVLLKIVVLAHHYAVNRFTLSKLHSQGNPFKDLLNCKDPFEILQFVYYCHIPH